MKQRYTDHPFFLTVERMLSMIPKMTASEKAELETWEKDNLGAGEKGTTYWPGWANVASRFSH